jgi:Ribbon-helix-helix protein, copG family
MREDRCPQLSVPIDAELKARLEAAAAREDRPVASLLRRYLAKALDGGRGGPRHDRPSAER